MPFLRVKEIREMSPEERVKRLKEFRTEFSKLQATIHAGGSVENPSRVKEIRKAIARIMTIQNEKATGVKERQ